MEEELVLANRRYPNSQHAVTSSTFAYASSLGTSQMAKSMAPSGEKKSLLQHKGYSAIVKATCER